MSSPETSSRTEKTLETCLRQHGVHLDGTHLRWNEDARDHPRNWRPITKYSSAFLISWIELYMTGISSAGTAAADTARIEYGLSRTVAYFAFITIYLLGQTIGGIFCAPVSETFGRRTIYIIGNLMFCVFSIVTGVPHSAIAVYFGRFFQGVASSIPATVAFGNFEDMFDARARIWVVYGYTFAGFVGLALGPIYSSYITHHIGWRWVFHISAIVSAVSAVLSSGIKESKAAQLLEAKAKLVREETARTDISTESSTADFSIQAFARDSLFRPLQFLVTEPIVIFCAALCAIAFGLIYGLTAGLTVAYTNPPFSNTFSSTSSSLSFIGILIGIILDIIPRFYDIHVWDRFHAHRRPLRPETKIRSFAVACPVFALGLWIFAWTVPPRVTSVPWPVSMIGLACVGFATADFSYVLFGYVTDSYGRYAASAVSALSTTRTMAAAVFPLFAYQMFSGLGTNVAVSILAAVATVFAFTPFLFLRYGEGLRQRSATAFDNDECLVEENRYLVEERGNIPD